MSYPGQDNVSRAPMVIPPITIILASFNLGPKYYRPYSGGIPSCDYIKPPPHNHIEHEPRFDWLDCLGSLPTSQSYKRELPITGLLLLLASSSSIGAFVDIPRWFRGKLLSGIHALCYERWDQYWYPLVSVCNEERTPKRHDTGGATNEGQLVGNCRHSIVAVLRLWRV